MLNNNLTANLIPPPLFFAQYKVYISHTDAGGIVYHANHLTFMEHCRRDWLTSLGIDGYFLADGTHFVVTKIEIDYKIPLLIDEVLTVCISKIKAKKASLILWQEIYKNGNDKPATTAIITLATIKKGGGICRLSQQILQKL